jgi:hypothetical protein
MAGIQTGACFCVQTIKIKLLKMRFGVIILQNKFQENDMNDKELREIRRRFRPEKNNILSIKGCLVSGENKILSKFSQNLAGSSVEESDMLLSTMKKALSGGLGINLIDLEFSARQTIDGEEHKLLMSLRNSCLKDEDALDAFYKKVIENVNFEGGYAILLASDNYDVYSYSSDGEKQDSTTLFSYIVCAVCPLKQSADGLYFREYDNSFRELENHSILSAPEIGFMFPAFDDRSSNIYGALYYTKNIADIHDRFINNIFGLNAPMSSVMKRDNFKGCLTDALEDECDFEVIKSIHSQVSELVAEHKETKNPEPLKLTKSNLKTALEYCGIAEDKVQRFSEKFDTDFGSDAEIPPKSIVDVKKFNLDTPDVSIKVNPDRTDVVSTQVINGVRYILIRANEGVEVNGVNIEIK